MGRCKADRRTPSCRKGGRGAAGREDAQRTVGVRTTEDRTKERTHAGAEPRPPDPAGPPASARHHHLNTNGPGMWGRGRAEEGVGGRPRVQRQEKGV